MDLEDGRPELVRPGQFGAVVPADTRRGVFDAHNEQILAVRAPVDAVFIGDSITEAWALDAYFRGEGGLLVNRGIGGDSTPYLRRRWRADALQLKPRLIVLLIGVNNTWDLDQWAEPSLLRTPGEIGDTIVQDVAAVVRETVEAGVPLALGSILPTDIPVLTSNRTRNRLIVEVNGRLLEVAREAGAMWVEYHAATAGEDGLTLRPGLAADGLHPHALGYRVMASVLLDALRGAGTETLRAAVWVEGEH